MTRDLFNRIKVVALVPPAAAVTNDTAIVSNIIDMAGYESCVLALVTGTDADADAVMSLKVEHGDVANLSDAASVAASDLQIDSALAATPGAGNQAAYDFSNDGVGFKIGYKGSKRYIRITETSGVGGVGANTGNIFLGGVAILSNARHQPAGSTQTP